MTALLQAEVVALRTTRTLVLALGAMLVATIVVVAVTMTQLSPAELRDDATTATVLGLGGSVACVFAFALGTVGIAGERRHRTLEVSVLALPHRHQLVLVKLAAYAGLGALLGVLGFLVAAVVSLPWLAGREVDVSLTSSEVWLVLGGAVLAGACFGAIGVGLGAAILSQSTALVVGLGWILLVDTAILAVSEEVARFSPGGAATALLTAGRADALQPPGWAAATLLLYCLVFGLAGVARLSRWEAR